MNAHDRLDHALAQITRECSPLCRVISDADDTNQAEAGGMLQERVIRDIAAALGCTAREYIG